MRKFEGREVKWKNGGFILGGEEENLLVFVCIHTCMHLFCGFKETLENN